VINPRPRVNIVPFSARIDEDACLLTHMCLEIVRQKAIHKGIEHRLQYIKLDGNY
jgi:hypothetical protein